MSTAAIGSLSATTPWSPGQLIGGYRVLRHLGSGGMGHVYEAERQLTGQTVALKVPHGGYRPASMARFLREARHAASIDSPHVARVIDADIDPEGTPFIVMERLVGETLAERLKQRGKLPWRDAAHLCAQACEGIAILHAAGLVHRDIKPSNLFLSRHEGVERVKVIDLGLACVSDRDAVSSASGVAAVGTLAYSAPEQLQTPDEVGASADVWSLGVTLHECLTGLLPFPGSHPSAVILEVVHAIPARAAELEPEIPEALQAIIDECLRKAHTLRPSVARVLENLRSVCAGTAERERFFRTGPNFRVVLRGRLFILLWLSAPKVEDVELLMQAGEAARAEAGRALVELVLAPPLLGLGFSEIRAGELMVRKFPEFVRNFERLFMMIESAGYSGHMLRAAATAVASGISTPHHVGGRAEILRLVAEHEGLPVEELDQLLRTQ